MTERDKFAELAALVVNAERIVFFGGAGVSTESGLKDYRSADGIYQTATGYGMPPEEILSSTCFWNDTELFYRFYRDHFLTDCKPNYAHKALAALEEMGKSISVITQNIDDLHRVAGSKTVYELHGSAGRYFCTSCGRKFGIDRLYNSPTNVPRCDCGEVIKPCVTLYGEMLDEDVTMGAIAAISSADLLIIAGTSLTVYPAASYINYFRGNNTVIINREPTPQDDLASLVFHDGIGHVFKETMKYIFGEDEPNGSR